MWFRIFLTSIFFLILNGCDNQIQIIDKPIIFNQERINLTKEYYKQRYDLERDTILITPKIIVLHWTVIPTMKKTFEAFNSPYLPSWRPDLENVSGLNVSSQFLVDQDGSIYRLMPENYMARHVIGLNHSSIGIENVGGNDTLPLTDMQVEANIKLVKYLKNKFPTIDYLIGHYEYTNFEGHELWLEVDDNYRTEKVDPGEKFMNSVRKGVKDLNFRKLPN